jgi:hypothetical protein
MPTIITRLYAAEEQALAAVESLKPKFGANEINLVTAASGDDAKELIAKGGVLEPHASAYAEKLKEGGAVVTVKAALFFARDALKHLEANDPVDAGIDADRTVPPPGWHNPAPFSSMLGIATIEKFKSDIVLQHDPAPFSDLLKLPVLSNLPPMAKLVNCPAPLSHALKLPTVIQMGPFSKLSDRKPKVTLVRL